MISHMKFSVLRNEHLKITFLHLMIINERLTIQF